MLRKLFSHNTATVSKEKTFIELILSGQLDQHQLYLELNKNGKSKFDFSENYGGLGLVLHKKPLNPLLSAAIKIDEKNESISIVDIDALIELAKAFKKGDTAGIDKNLHKYIICLALAFNQTPDARLRKQIADEVAVIYQDYPLKNYADRLSILGLVKPKRQGEPVVVTAIPSAPIVVSKPTYTQATVVIPKENYTIALVNALRKLIVENINTWKHMTTGRLLFFTGSRIEYPDPAKNSLFLRVPDGIAKMFNVLKEKNMLYTDVTNLSDANDVLQSLTRIAIERAKLGARSDVRHHATNRLYVLLASLSSAFNAQNVTANKMIKTGNVTVDADNVTKDLVAEIATLLQHPNHCYHSNVVILRR